MFEKHRRDMNYKIIKQCYREDGSSREPELMGHCRKLPNALSWIAQRGHTVVNPSGQFRNPDHLDGRALIYFIEEDKSSVYTIKLNLVFSSNGRCLSLPLIRYT